MIGYLAYKLGQCLPDYGETVILQSIILFDMLTVIAGVHRTICSLEYQSLHIFVNLRHQMKYSHDPEIMVDGEVIIYFLSFYFGCSYLQICISLIELIGQYKLIYLADIF